MKKLFAGTTANDGTGTNAPAAAAIINENFVEVQRYVGWAGEERWAQAGDSMAGFATISAWSAVMAVVRMLYYDYNFTIDSNRYYDADTEVDAPPGQRGLNFGKGGTTTQHMLDVQLPKILQAINDGMKFSTVFVSPLQNDRFSSLADARAAVARVLTLVDTLLNQGKRVFMLGIWPQTDLVVNGTANAYSKHYIERALTLASQARPGFIYVPMLEKLKTGVAAEEAAGKVNYKSGYSFDGIHAIDGAARALAPHIAPYIKRIAAPRPVPTYDALPFDETKNPLGNIFGAPGRFGGANGTIIDTSKAEGAAGRTTTNASVPAGIDIRYDTTKGVVLTPRLVNDPNEPYEVAISGVPTVDGLLDLAILTSTARFFPAAKVRMAGEIRLIDVEGIRGIGAGQIAHPFPIGAGIGSLNGSVVPYPRNEVINLSSMDAVPYGNQYGEAAKMGVTIAVLAGVEVKGAIRFRRLGLFPSDYI